MEGHVGTKEDLQMDLSVTLEPEKNWMVWESLTAGTIIGDGFTVVGKADYRGNQSEFYYLKKNGRDYVLKLYYQMPHKEYMDFIKNAGHDNIVEFMENGIYEGERYYEIMRNYENGDLGKTGTPEADYIKKVVVPSVNNGLHYIHENGFLHLDIKPENLFISGEKDRILIGDFGSAALMDGNGYVIVDHKTGRTPEYSLPVKSVYGTIRYAASDDYASFGLVLFRLFTGYSALGGYTSLEEQAKEYFRNGIQIPEHLEENIKKLLKGLLEENEDDRWGYREVKNWCETIRTVKKNGRASFVFGNIEGKPVIVTDEEELAGAIRKYWKYAKNMIKRVEFKDFIRIHRPDCLSEVEKLRYEENTDIAIFKLLYSIKPSREIYFRGHCYASVSEYLDKVSEQEKDAVFLIKKGLFIYYLRKTGVDENQVNIVKQILNETPDVSSAAGIITQKICNAPLELDGKRIETVEVLIDHMTNMEVSDLIKIAENSEVTAWLYKMGLDKKVLRLGERL